MTPGTDVMKGEKQDLLDPKPSTETTLIIWGVSKSISVY